MRDCVIPSMPLTKWRKAFEEFPKDRTFPNKIEFFADEVGQRAYLALFADFMEGWEGSGTCSPRRTIFQYFCGDLRHIELSTTIQDSSKVALVSDRIFHGLKWCPRPLLKPLNAYQLHDALRNPGFGNNGCLCSNAGASIITSCADSSPSQLQPSGGKALELTSECRIVYITDLTPRIAVALVTAASVHHHETLRNLLYHHLASKPYAGMRITSGLSTFDISFIFPFQALRSVQEGQNLPSNAQDVSFLSGSKLGTVYICPASYSCGVVGTDVWRWVAYCFVDTYFDGSDDGRESAQDRWDDSVGAGSLPIEPCGDGNFTFEGTGGNPRGWFLLIMNARLRLVVAEWLKLVTALEEWLRSEDKVRHSASEANEYYVESAHCVFDQLCI